MERMEELSTSAVEMFRASYKSEALISKLAYYLFIGDYHSYLRSADDQYAYFSSNFDTSLGCNPYPKTRYTLTAYSQELLKNYEEVEKLWTRRDYSELVWTSCHNSKFPNNPQLPLSLLPVFQQKVGHIDDQASNFYIREAEDHFNSYADYATIGIQHLKATHLGFLKSQGYSNLFENILDQIATTKDFTEATVPFANYAYFSTRDRLYEKAKDIYNRMFDLNSRWINDMIFTFGEKAFVTYFNSKLRDGYQNYHSLVKLASDDSLSILPVVSSQAYNNLLLTKSIAFKSSQKRKEAFINSNNSNVRLLYDQWQGEKEQLMRIYQKSAENSEQIGRDDQKLIDITALQDNIDKLENQLANASQNFKELMTIDEPDWRSLRDELKEGEAAVELVKFQWRDQIYYSDTAFYAAYIVKPNSQYPEVAYLTTTASDLEDRHYNVYRNNIKFRLEDSLSYKQYWEPLKEKLEGIKKIYLSPDGIYHLINLPTLRNLETGEYLLDEIEIQYVTTTASINSRPLKETIETAVLVGRPKYETENLMAPVGTPTRSFVRNFGNTAISDLPGTEQEVVAIQKQMVGVDVELLINEEATEDHIYELYQPDILHIATHGYWSKIEDGSTDGYRSFNAMVNSGLLFSGVSNYYSAQEKPDTNDGILTAYEAKSLDLEGTDLVVLSACETGLGHFGCAGEGVYGLQRAFRAAGARSVITSLWKVDDDTTRDFMITFYQMYLTSQDKFNAFRNAQKEIRKRYNDPYFWGAFVLNGI